MENVFLKYSITCEKMKKVYNLLWISHEGICISGTMRVEWVVRTVRDPTAHVMKEYPRQCEYIIIILSESVATVKYVSITMYSLWHQILIHEILTKKKKTFNRKVKKFSTLTNATCEDFHWHMWRNRASNRKLLHKNEAKEKVMVIFYLELYLWRERYKYIIDFWENLSYHNEKYHNTNIWQEKTPSHHWKLGDIMF